MLIEKYTILQNVSLRVKYNLELTEQGRKEEEEEDENEDEDEDGKEQSCHYRRRRLFLLLRAFSGLLFVCWKEENYANTLHVGNTNKEIYITNKMREGSLN